MATLLLELFSEEIPSRMQRGAAEQLQRLLTAGLEKAEFKPADIKTFVSPRHLAIQLSGLPEMQKDVSEERKGPKVGAPDQAMKGFLNSVGLTVEQCEQHDGYYFATIHRKGRPTTDVAKEIIESALSAFVWPKSMRWGANSYTWVRPLHRIVCLLDKKTIPVQFAGLTASNITEGHRFLNSGTVTIAEAAQYVETLKKAHVIVDFAARRELVKTEIEKLAKQHSLTLVQDEALLDEVTGLVEWPVALLGSFDKKFLELPKEVPISEMKVHQRYFALQDAKGNLSNSFIAVANMVTADGGKKIAEGNARVLRARLSDGAFYWEQDRRKPLSDWATGLSDVVFHAKVGMVSDKVKRIETLALALAKEIGFKDTKSVERAAQLCKADLTTGMVGEFPELQGIMGRYYALDQKEKPEIADAIRDHYKPLGAADSLPESELAAIIAIADKLDSIVAMFAAGGKPTGSKDPFAVRRAAVGLANIDLAFEFGLPLIDLIKLASKLVHEDIRTHLFGDNEIDEKSANAFEYFTIKKAIDVGDFIIEINQFILDRLKASLSAVRPDVLTALDASKTDYNLLQYSSLSNALNDWLETNDGAESLAAIKRALNILAAEEKKSKANFQFAAAQKAKFAKPAEQQLLAALQQKVVSLDTLSKLATPINTFFDDVLVTEEGHRDARLSLLAGVREAALQIADFSKIEG